MGLLSGIFGRDKAQKTAALGSEAVPFEQSDEDTLKSIQQMASEPNFEAMPADFNDPEPGELEDMNLETIESVVDTIGKHRKKSVNIWDVEGSADDGMQEEVPNFAPSPSTAGADLATIRARRNRTRLIGFETSDGGNVDLFSEEQTTAATEQVQFPVGWLLIEQGPGRGHCFALTPGMAQIGRDADQAIQLDFGDASISRNNHAAIVFDPETQEFLLGHGGKANIVRLNGKPVISNETLRDGDRISIGETVLYMKPLCGSNFSWADASNDEDLDNDMAIA